MQKPVPPGVSAADVIGKYFTAVGGKDKLTAVKDLQIVSESAVQGQKAQTCKVYCS